MSYTINPNAKNRWARNAENTMDLSLETDASSVYLDNGRTLEQEIGEGSMVSNVATVDTSMSKIINGTLDGAYESLVFKGKSLINLVEKPTSANVGNGGKWNGYGGGNPSKTFITNGIRLANTQHGSIVLDYFDLSLFKPNTKYTLFIDVYHNGKGNPPVLDKIAGTGQYAISLKNGHNCIVFTTIPDLTSANMGIRFGYAGSTSELCVYEFSNIVIIEGDHSSINPDYFEGICDVKMPILRNVGKNLFNGELEMGGYTGSSGLPYDSDIRVRSVEKIFLPEEMYTLSSDGATKTIFTIYDLNGVFKKEFVSNNSSCTITLNEDCMVHICVENEKLLNSHIQLEQGSNVTSYEEHKTNILHTPEIVTLRSLPNGVRDELNLKTGEYVQRIGEIVLDGSEGWGYQPRDNEVNTLMFQCGVYGMTILQPEDNHSDKVLACDKHKVLSSHQLWGTDTQAISKGQSTKQIRVRVLKSNLATLDVAGFKLWLSQNLITVQYELATPIITTIEPLTTPFAYENGHIILESGYEGQSLLPTLDYSTVVNKTGLVESVAKTIQRQEKQLTMLEKMLIQNIINLDYNNTLLTLKNEMEEML